MMKKIVKQYFSAWIILFVLFNIIAFVSVGWTGQEKYTASFWIGYGFIIVAFIGQLVCAYIALQKKDIKKIFYNISLISTSYIGLILSFVFGGLCMLLSALPYWIGIILCAIVLALNAIAVIKASAAIDIVERIDEKIESNTQFIKSLTSDADVLCHSAKSDAVKKECKKVWESIRYSDPLSNPSLNEIENRITAKFVELSEAAAQDDQSKTAEFAEEMLLLVNERKKRCKLLK